MTLPVFLFVISRISMVFLLLFLCCFLPLKHRGIVTAAICAACFAATSAAGYLALSRFPDSVTQVLSTMVQILMVQGTAFALSRYRDARTLFTGITAAAYVMFGDVASDAMAILWRQSWLSFALQAAIHAGLLTWMVRKMRAGYLSVLATDSAHWLSLCSIPSLFYAAIYALSIWPSTLRENPKTIPAAALVLLLLPISYVEIFGFLAQRKKEEEILQRNRCLEMCANGVRNEAAALQNGERELSRLRHDMRHYAQGIQSYLNAGEYAKAEDALREVNDRVTETTPHHFCDNVVVNGVMEHFSALAKKEQMTLDCVMSVPRSLAENEFEYAAVISNLMDNALRATAELPERAQRVITVRASDTRGGLLLEISNPYCGRIDISDETGRPLSRRGQGHGYGMESVAAFADKYGATFDCEAKHQRFFVRLLMGR